MANYPFKINITTKDNTKISFYTGSFATSADTVVSASVMVDRINNMKSGSNFVDSIEAPTSLATHGSSLYGETGGGLSPTGKNNGIKWLSASFDHPNTGSITFTDTETAASGGLDFYTFHGTKVCSVLGLPEGIPIYTENFKLSDSSTDTTNYISGEFVSDSIALKKGFKMSSQARMRSNLIWDDVFGEGLIQWVSGSTSKMSMGYNDISDYYFVSAPQITGSVAQLFNINTNVINGLQTTTQQIKFDPNDITFVENNVETMLMKDSFIMINPNGASGADVDFYLSSNNGTTLLHSDAGNNKVNMAGVLDITNNTDASDDTGDTGALRVEGGASINGVSYFGSTINQGSTAGLAVSSSLVFQVPIDSSQNINAGGAGTEFSPAMGIPSSKDTTYISHTNGGASFDLKVVGEYQVTCDLVVSDSATTDRHTFFGYIEHLTAGGSSTIYKFPIGGVYIRGHVDGYDGGGLGGQARIITSTANERIRIRTIVLERQNSGTCNLDTSLSRVRVQHITYGTPI